MSGFSIALTGLQAATTDLDVIGNNIANANTVGFKSSSVEFSDVFASTVGVGGTSSPVGSGVRVAGVNQDFSEGNRNSTNNNLHLAIDGPGYFVVSEQQGDQRFTRDGEFQLDESGFLVTSEGKYVQGYGVDAQGNLLTLGDLAITDTQIPPQATVNIALSVNIDSNSDASEQFVPYDKDDPSTYTYTTTLRTYDGLGEAHSIKLDFVEQDAIRRLQTLDLDTANNGFVNGDTLSVSGITMDLNLLFNGNAAQQQAEIDTLMAADPRIASVALDVANEDIQITFNASAGHVEDIQASGLLLTGISSEWQDANEVHTIAINPAAFDNTGALVNDTTIEIAGVQIALTAGMTEQDVSNSILQRVNAMIQNNPKIEDISLNSTNGSYDIVVTYDAVHGDVEDSDLGLVQGSSNGNPLLSSAAVVDGDNSYQGVYGLYAYRDGEELLDMGKVVDPGEIGHSIDATEPGPILMQFSSGRLSTLNGESVTSLNPPTLQLSGVDPFNPSATIELSLDGSTQFSGTSRVLSRTEDGYPPGELVGVSFGSGGEMVASYSNDVDRTVGVVALATFASDSGLEPSGSNEWMASQASGDAILDVPGTGTRGSISSRELESSNVDLTAQLIALIQAQQNYQANSKTIEAQDSLIQTILQIS